MKINDGIKTFKSGDNLEGKEERRERCHMLVMGDCEGHKKIPFMNKEHANRFKERDSLKKVERHDGRWTNAEKNSNQPVRVGLSDESDSKTRWWP